MSRSKLNYWVDVVIAIAFLISAVSGIVFLLPLGFGSSDNRAALGISYTLWDQLHVWGSLAMIAGVGAHLVLHVKWLVVMTKRMVGGGTAPRPRRKGTPQVASRRRLLKTGGAALGGGVVLAACGAALVGLGSLMGLFGEGRSDETTAGTPGSVSQSGAPKADGAAGAHPGDGDSDGTDLLLKVTSTEPTSEPTYPAATPEAPTATPVATPSSEPTQDVPPVEEAAAEDLCVLCPHGVVNDPYPGRCRKYNDRDGDGLCDYSVPVPCG